MQAQELIAHMMNSTTSKRFNRSTSRANAENSPKIQAKKAGAASLNRTTMMGIQSLYNNQQQQQLAVSRQYHTSSTTKNQQLLLNRRESNNMTIQHQHVPSRGSQLSRDHVHHSTIEETTGSGGGSLDMVDIYISPKALGNTIAHQPRLSMGQT